MPGHVAQSEARLTQEPEVPCSMLGPATYFPFFFRLFKKGSCQLLVKVFKLILHVVNCVGGLGLPRNSVVRLTDRGRTALKQHNNNANRVSFFILKLK